jgi:hypothetical protein
MEYGRQAFGAAVKALGALHAGSWPLLSEYLKHVDAYHEGYFVESIFPHFIKTHCWRDESFNLALALFVQARGNLFSNYKYVWRDMKMAINAERLLTPSDFAARMIAVRDQTSSAEHVSEKPASTYGWPNYDSLFKQIAADLTPWETGVFEVLKTLSAA